jgi:hypothetical protein
MVKLSSILLVLTLFTVRCRDSNQNYLHKSNVLKTGKESTSSSQTSSDTSLSLSDRIKASDAKQDSIQKFLLNSYWKSYKPDSISNLLEEYTYTTQKRIWNSNYIILKGYINDIIALDKNNSQLIIWDFFSDRYFIVNITNVQADSILKIGNDNVFAFLLVKDFAYNFQIINEVSGWSGKGENSVDINYNKKYELITRCNLIDIFFDKK